MYRERFIIWRIRKGSVDHLVVAAMIATLLMIPLFRFFTSAFATFHRIEQAKEILEIASLTTYNILDQERLGIGDLDIQESTAARFFQIQVRYLINKTISTENVGESGIRFRKDGNKIDIESNMTVYSEFGEEILVRKSLEFIIDPVTEDP